MPKFVELLSLVRAPMIEVISVTAVEDPPEAGLIWLVNLDTPVDGGAGIISVYVSDERARELALI